MGRRTNKYLGITKAKRKTNKALRGGMKKKHYDAVTGGQGCQLVLMPILFTLLLTVALVTRLV